MRNLENLEEDIKSLARQCERKGKQNYVALYVLYLLSILASAVATILVAIGKSGPMLAAITALPGIAIVANNSLKLQERSAWQYEKALRVTSLFRQLRDGRSPRDVVSTKLDNLEKDMGKTWPEWGEVPEVPGKPTQESS